MSEHYDDNTLWVTRVALARSIAGGDEAKVVLDAVAPLIATKALRDAAQQWAGATEDDGDLVNARDVSDWLRDRADEIELGRS